MRFQFETFAKKQERLREWRPFFAFWPRKVADGQYRLLERIERRGYYVCGRSGGYFSFEYRAGRQS